jgi:hypothetical protein
MVRPTDTPPQTLFIAFSRPRMDSWEARGEPTARHPVSLNSPYAYARGLLGPDSLCPAASALEVGRLRKPPPWSRRGDSIVGRSIEADRSRYLGA